MSEAIRVVPHEALDPGPSTAGMVRNTAAATDTLWVGEVRTAPGAWSGWHHHGEHTTYGRVVSGQLHFEFGRMALRASVQAPAISSSFHLTPSIERATQVQKNTSSWEFASEPGQRWSMWKGQTLPDFHARRATGAPLPG